MTDFQSPVDVFQKTLQHEQMVTGMINKLYELALKENDYPTQVLLQWYITEQVEEEKNAADIVQQLELVEARGTAVFMLDHQLSKRGA
jgi:ferritin